MHVTRESKTSTQTLLTITATAEDLTPVKNHVLGHFRNSVKVPGFRAGKAPLAVVEKHIDQQAFLDEFLERALNELYRQAVATEHLRPAAMPKVEVKKFVPYTMLEFTADVEVIGEIKLANYKNLKIAKPAVTVAAGDINDVLANLRSRMAKRTDVKRAAKAGDELIIDFSGKDTDGNPITDTDGQDYPLILGSKTFIPGFEEKLTGLKADDDKEFDITFPKDYAVATLRSKKVTFKVHVKKVQALKEPKLDDDFAKKAGPFKNLAELKADIKNQIKNERHQQADRAYENQIIQQIVEKSSVDIPDSIVSEQLDHQEQEEKNNLAYRGQTWQEHLKEEGVTEEQHRTRQRPDAELRVKAGLVLSEIAQAEQITVQPEELDLRIQMLKGQHQDEAMQAELGKPENRQDIAARMLSEKTIAKLVGYSSAK